jgi:tetratricopeptide (TPR) repeat protein
VELSLTPSRRLQALAASACLAAVLCWFAAVNWIADHRIHSDRRDVIERGAKLEPGNADGWDRLGRTLQWDLADSDPSEAVSAYQKAVNDNPRWAPYWMDLASGYEAAGDPARAREALDRAREVAPVLPEVAWNYGNFLLRQQDFALGYAEIRHSVQYDPSLLPLAISRAWRSTRDVDQLMTQVLPHTLDAYLQALDFFSSNRQADSALKVWPYLLKLGQPLPIARTFPFFEDLIQEDRGAEARQAWLQAVAAAGLPNGYTVAGSQVWDGRFNQPFADGGLGWRWNAPLSAAIDFDSAPNGLSGRAVRLDFGGGSNLELDEPVQFVPVEPDRTYHFHALLRTEAITTESGMRFRLSDPHHPQLLDVTTENLTGTNRTKAVDVEVTTSPNTHFLTIRLFRAQSRLFDNKLSGIAWIADVSLVAAEASQGQAKP